MFRTLAKQVPHDKDLPARAHTIDVLNRFLDGTIYDVLPHDFHEERDTDGTYIPMAKRAPSVRYGLLNTVVSDSVSFLFSENHFPEIDCDKDDAAEETIKAIIKDCKLNETMLDAATRGSVGSVCIWVRVLGKRLFFEAMTTTFLTPTFQAESPDTLQKVTEKYKVQGQVLKDLGYAIPGDTLTQMYWFMREWDDKREIWYLPWLVSAKDAKVVTPVIDKLRTVSHGLGFVPMVWVLNLPGGDKIDGKCTFRGAIETGIEIDFQLSQAGRGLKYSSSPTIVFKDNGPNSNKEIISGDSIVVPTDGDAKMLEISGDASKAVIEYVREIRKLALETVGGSRADSDKLSAATSGRAMEMMNQSLIWLADKLRISYGEGALLKLLKMIAELTREMNLVDSDGAKIPAINDGAKITLKWPKWYAPTSDDRQADALALTTLTGGGIMSKKTAVTALANDYDVEDIDTEMSEIESDSQADLANQMALNPPQIPKPQPAK